MMRHKIPWIGVLAISAVVLTSCQNQTPLPPREATQPAQACAVALSPHQGNDPLDQAIIQVQDSIRQSQKPSRALERLGWLFIAKARRSYDPGYYTLAEQTAWCLDARQPRSAAALLLRGHVLHNLHRFREAETLARELVAQRQSPFDYGLLGDVLMEQGQLDAAAAAYQQMMDLKPSLQAYSRAAHLRWLKGDLPGAIEAMRMAANAGSPRDLEASAWAYARLAFYELQSGAFQNAWRAGDMALALQPDSAAALLMRGQLLLAQGQYTDAVAPLQRAATLNPLPAYQWTLAEALTAAGRQEEARTVEAHLVARGAADDPRTLALYLATRNIQVQTALRLAQQERGGRADVFTLDALAWTLAAAGKADEAHTAMRQALAAGTQEARLFYHAGVIATQVNRHQEAQQWFRQAAAIQHMLLPSERADLTRHLSAVGSIAG